jgi:REP element-mobilizing transposase RayT
MARPLRILYPGAVYHITSRGNERKPVFVNDDDRVDFLHILRHVTERFHWICHAYSLMGNHYHLLIETPEGNLSSGMRQLNGVYTQSFNRRNNRVGHLFQGRFKAVLIQKDSHLLEVCRYVVLNPVRALMVTKPEEWKWSSYRATAGIEKPQPCLSVDWILMQFGSKKAAAQREYRRFVSEGISERSLWKDVKAQSVLGEEEFTEKFEEYVKGYQDIPEIPKSQRFLQRPSLPSLFGDETLQDLPKRNDAIAKAIEEYGYSQREVADKLGMHFTSISRIMRTRAVMPRK